MRSGNRISIKIKNRFPDRKIGTPAVRALLEHPE